jgi:hypothetical protein
MAKLTWEELEAQAREEERKLYMTENRIKQKFISKHIKDFAKLIKADEEKPVCMHLSFLLEQIMTEQNTQTYCWK